MTVGASDVHSAVDDRTWMTYAEILEGGTAATAAAVPSQVKSWLTDGGVVAGRRTDRRRPEMHVPTVVGVCSGSPLRVDGLLTGTVPRTHQRFYRTMAAGRGFASHDLSELTPQERLAGWPRIAKHHHSHSAIRLVFDRR